MKQYAERKCTMYNLIVVDDETLTINMLKNYIDWNRYNFNLVQCFSTASEALLYTETNPVHAVITDICMPDMDGIELAKKIREKHPDMAIGFISAHRNFDYALTVANMGFCGYILKPIIKKELCSLCEKLEEYVKNHITENQRDIGYNTLKFESAETQLKCQEIVSDILYKTLTDCQKIDAKFRELNIDIAVNCKSAIMDINLTDFQNYLSNTWKHSSLLLYNALSTLVSYNNTGIITLPLAYYKDKLLVLAVAKKGYNHTFCEELKQVTDVIVQNLNNILNISQIDIFVTDVFDNLTEISDFTKPGNKINFVSNDSLIKEIIAYTDENYASITSINAVAEHFHFSPVYFGRYFQKRTNKSFKAYLNGLKITKAKDLLRNTDMKISGIAGLLGFKNESYFYTVFKNTTGVTPNQYRETDNIY